MNQIEAIPNRPSVAGGGENRIAPLRLVADDTVIACDGPEVAIHVAGEPSLVHRASVYERFGKPLIDRVAASIALALLAAPLALVALAVRLRLGSPVLFRQERVGRGSEPITVLKFRTMHPCRRAVIGGNEDYNGEDRRVSHKRADDPRLTRLGRLLRTFSIDELPQLVNVARGEMSLVGPRPELPHVVAGYEPWQLKRLVVRPGLTGYWQTKARNQGPMHTNTQYDCDYVDDLSLSTDVKILASTLPAILGEQRGH